MRKKGEYGFLSRDMYIISTIPIMECNMMVSLANKAYANKVFALRFNLSKLHHKNYRHFINTIEKIKKISNNIDIILDLPYPCNNRRCYFKQNVLELKKHQLIKLNSESNISFDSLGYINTIKLDSYFKINKCYLCSDGLGNLKVVEIQNEYVVFEVLNDFTFRSGKSISSDVMFCESELPEKIVEMLNYIKPDAIMYSFVNNVDFLENYNKQLGFDYKSIMKIETLEGVNNIEQICKGSDMVMVARGDLALNCGVERLLFCQEKIVEASNLYGCEAIVATDILTSLISNIFPSRADIIDVNLIHKSKVRGIMFNVSILFSDNFQDAVRIAYGND